MHYVILRNYKHLNNIGNDDIDILVYDKQKASLLLNAKKISAFSFKSNYSINIANKTYRVDIRDVDDKYYCKDWCEDILRSRIKYGKFFVPDKQNHDHLLTYHAYIHKYSIPEKYIRLFKNKNKKWLDLKNFMKLNNYDFVEPNDLSVAFNSKSGVKKISLKRRTYNLIREIKNNLINLLPHNFIIIVKKINAKIFT